jgi:DNA-binding MarR family transcriptional regulator
MADPEPVSFATTLQVRDTCLCLHVQRAARSLARRFDTALRPVGLTNEQFSLMMALNRPAPPTLGEVAAVLGADRTTLTAALRTLARRGLVAQESDARDRRFRRIALTAGGRARLAAALPRWTAVHGALETELEDRDADRLRLDLRALAANPPAAHGRRAG